MLSIIIPTLNEEQYLPKLLDSIKKQTFKGYEVIIVDGNSEDRTKEVANSYKKKIKSLKFIQVKKINASHQRNKGAELAKGSLLIFLDADGILPSNFIEGSLKELKKKNLDTAAVYIIPISKNIIDKFVYIFANSFFFALQKIFPHCTGSCIIAKKEVHKKIKGFDEDIKLGEDHNYVKRAAKHFKFGMLSTKIYISNRRYIQDGRLITGLKYFIAFFHRLFLGEIKSEVYRYKFGHYKQK
jgi:glycosyltransferase involved in cell wall biosynthesis